MKEKGKIYTTKKVTDIIFMAKIVMTKAIASKVIIVRINRHNFISSLIKDRVGSIKFHAR